MSNCIFQKVIRVFAASALVFGAAITGTAGAAYNGIYVNPGYYQISSPSFQSAAINSGFNAIFLFAASVDTNGSISWNGQMLAQNGSYVGDSALGSSIAALRPAIGRIEIVIGGAGDTSFAQIQSLIASQGTGASSILYKNFQALKNATGIDAIQYDDEVNYDVPSSVAFGNMIAALGMKVTLCPYTAQSYWVNVNSQLGSKVDAIWLQCYDGGAGNNPGQWIAAFGGASDVYPGLWGNTSDPPTVTSEMRSWQKLYGITGGYMWLNAYLPSDAPKWAQAVIYGLDPLNGLIAEDFATNYYVPGFTGNEGFGYGAWTLSTAGGGDYISGDSPALFGLWNGAANSQSTAVRSLNTPLIPGQSLLVQLEMTTLDSSSNTNAFQLFDANGNVLFRYFHVGGDNANAHYMDATGSHTATGFAYDYTQLDSFQFALNNTTNYTFTDLTTANSFSGTLSGAAISQVGFLRANGTSKPSNGQDFKFNGLVIYTPTNLSTALQPVAQGWKILFGATPCLTYRVQRATQVTGPWSTIGKVFSQFDQSSYIDTSKTGGSAFYRAVTP